MQYKLSRSVTGFTVAMMFAANVVLATDDISKCLPLSETVNGLDEETNEFSSDIAISTLLTKDHVVVETGYCFDDEKVYSLSTVYGVYNAVTDQVGRKFKSISGAHGEEPVSDKVTCETLSLAKGERMSGIVIYSNDDTITKLTVLAKE